MDRFQKLYVVILIYCSIIVTASLLSYFDEHPFGVRAYVGAEGIWSRHQKMERIILPDTRPHERRPIIRPI